MNLVSLAKVFYFRLPANIIKRNKKTASEITEILPLLKKETNPNSYQQFKSLYDRKLTLVKVLKIC